MTTIIKVENPRQILESLSLRDFANLGIHEYAYVTPATDTCGDSYCIHAANGDVLAQGFPKDVAESMIREHGLIAVELH